jgi:regulator of cell morphogenesis and NO signaling
LEIDELTRFIEKYHHLYTYENVKFIKNNIARLVQMYGAAHRELEEVSQVFVEMTTHLTVHMGHEEHILFPYIRQMVKKGGKVRSSFFKSVASPINTMVMDHSTEDKCLRKLDDLTHHYSAPVKECTAFRVTYQALEELEKDLQTHIRLENEILFPKALEMESDFNMRPYRPN